MQTAETDSEAERVVYLGMVSAFEDGLRRALEEAVATMKAMKGDLKTKQPGATLQATLERTGSSVEIACVLEHRPQPKPPQKATRARGLGDNSMEPS
jgi:hypothetical protein